MWYKYVVAFSKICLGGNEKKAREIFDGLCSSRDSNRALASLEGLSETMKQVKDIHQDLNWVPPPPNTGVLISPQPDQEVNILQRQKILIFIYPIYYHNWRSISTIYIYIYITRLASKKIFSPSNKIHREVGRAKVLSAPLYNLIFVPLH